LNDWSHGLPRLLHALLLARSLKVLKATRWHLRRAK
jgi:hypothetical protein